MQIGAPLVMCTIATKNARVHWMHFNRPITFHFDRILCGLSALNQLMLIAWLIDWSFYQIHFYDLKQFHIVAHCGFSSLTWNDIPVDITFKIIHRIPAEKALTHPIEWQMKLSKLILNRSVCMICSIFIDRRLKMYPSTFQLEIGHWSLVVGQTHSLCRSFLSVVF